MDKFKEDLMKEVQSSRRKCDTPMSRFNVSKLSEDHMIVFKWKNIGEYGEVEINYLFKG